MYSHSLLILVKAEWLILSVIVRELHPRYENCHNFKFSTIFSGRNFALDNLNFNSQPKLEGWVFDCQGELLMGKTNTCYS